MKKTGMFFKCFHHCHMVWLNLSLEFNFLLLLIQCSCLVRTVVFFLISTFSISNKMIFKLLKFTFKIWHPIALILWKVGWYCVSWWNDWDCNWDLLSPRLYSILVSAEIRQKRFTRILCGTRAGYFLLKVRNLWVCGRSQCATAILPTSNLNLKSF